MKENKTLLGLLMVLVTVTAYPQTNADKTFTIENYYKVKWGYADEFLELYNVTITRCSGRLLKKVISFPLYSKSRGNTAEKRHAGIIA